MDFENVYLDKRVELVVFNFLDEFSLKINVSRFNHFYKIYVWLLFLVDGISHKSQYGKVKKKTRKPWSLDQ